MLSGRDRSIIVVKYHGLEYTHHDNPGKNLDPNLHEGALEAGACGAQILCGAICSAAQRDCTR